MQRRPSHFVLNASHPLATGLVFAGLAPGGLVGSTVYPDSSMYRRHGTLTNMDASSDWVWSAALSRWVCDFAAASSQYVLSATTILQSNARAIAFWVDTTNTVSTHTGICLDKTGSTQDGSVVDWQGAVTGWRFFGYEGGSAKGLITKAPASTAWHHVVAQFNGSLWELYVNAGTPATTTSAATLNSNDGGLSIATRPGGTAFTGEISDVMVWDGRMLSPAEIQILADRADPMLGGLILPAKRRWWPVGDVSAAGTTIPIFSHHYTQMMAG